MAKALFLGVVSFGSFVPDSGSDSVTIFTAMVNLPKTVEIISVLNEMHTNSYTGPRLSLAISTISYIKLAISIIRYIPSNFNYKL